MVESRSCVQREGVYRWFSSLSSAQRAEFLCGSSDLCVPVESRFLGSCSEDSARKDYHSSRDAEIKANNPADSSGLTNVTDEVVRSKSSVSSASSGSDNREAAGVSYRTSTHIDSVINNYGSASNDGRTEEQFSSSFTMASNHPAFNFHQKQVSRQQSGHIQDISQNHNRDGSAEPGPPSGAALGSEEQAIRQEPPPPRPELRSPPPAHVQVQDPPSRSRQEKAGKAPIERVVLRRVTRKSENGSEYVFEVGWSDGFTSSVVRTQREVAESKSQLSQVFPDDGSEKFLPPSLEVDTRCSTGLPSDFSQHPTVQSFFTSSRPSSPSCPPSPPSTRLPPPSSFPSGPGGPACPLASSSHTGCMVHYRGANRAVYRVASVQPVVSTNSSVPTRSPPHLSSLSSPPVPPPPPSSMNPPALRSSAAAGGDASYPQHHLHPQTSAQPSMQSSHSSHSQQVSQSHPSPRSQSHPAHLAPAQSSAPEQNGISDWSRKLRLHKYYPVFKQLTMEEFSASTEEDLNKYDSTQGAKKKLKTQSELQKSADREMKTEKRPCGGIARVTPSSHVGVSTSTAGESRSEVDGVPHPHHHSISTDSSSSSGYSGSSWMPLCCDAAFDRNRDVSGRVSGPNPPGGPEKDRFILSSSCSGRPTAQVLPVQTDPAPSHPPSCSSHLPFSLSQTPYHPQPSYPARISSPPRKPRPSPLCPDGRTKPPGGAALGAGFGLGPGVGVAVRSENQFSALSVDGCPEPQEPAVCRGRTGGAIGSMVETSSASTSTSNSLHHVSQPPLLFHLSSSPPGNHFHPPTTSSRSTNPFYQPVSSPAPPASSSDQGSASACVCSSCGCRGNCSPCGYAAAGYSQPSSFTSGPSLHLSPLISSSSNASPGAPPFSYPMMVPPPLYRQSPTSHDQQQGFRFYQPHGVVGNGGQKRAAGNVSCYNCGSGGHRAEDCKQPSMDSAQQGTFRSKFIPHSQSSDSGD